jgi:hypothetical protein
MPTLAKKIASKITDRWVGAKNIAAYLADEGLNVLTGSRGSDFLEAFGGKGSLANAVGLTPRSFFTPALARTVASVSLGGVYGAYSSDTGVLGGMAMGGLAGIGMQKAGSLGLGFGKSLVRGFRSDGFGAALPMRYAKLKANQAINGFSGFASAVGKAWNWRPAKDMSAKAQFAEAMKFNSRYGIDTSGYRL